MSGVLLPCSCPTRQLTVFGANSSAFVLLNAFCKRLYVVIHTVAGYDVELMSLDALSQW